MVRHIVHRDRLFRTVQGVAGGDERLGAVRLHRFASGPLALRALDSVQHPALLLADVRRQYPQTEYSGGNFLIGAGLRRQRPREFRGRARGRLRLLHDGARVGRCGHDDGRTGDRRFGQYPAAARGGSDHDRDAVDVAPRAVGFEDGAVAVEPERGRGALRFVGRLARPGSRGHERECLLRTDHARPSATGGGGAFRETARGGARRRIVRPDPRHGESHHGVDPHFDRHVAQTSAVDHLRLLHGFDGLVAGGPCVGSRECRLPHHGRANRRVGVVRDGLRRLYDRLSGGIDADVRRQCGRSDRIGAVRLDARAQQPQEEQGGWGR